MGQLPRETRLPKTTIKRRLVQAGLLAVCATSVATPVAAQVPGIVAPGQVERQFQAPPQPQSLPGAPRIPETGQVPPANAGQIRFTLQRIELAGVSVYGADALRALWAESLGKTVSLTDIYAIAERLTARYRNDGYILSQVLVPAQTVEQGVVRLTAVEGRVAAVRVRLTDGAVDAALVRNIEALAAPVTAARPLTAAVLERALLLVNDLPGVSMRGVLSAAPGLPGASDLLIEATPRRLGAGLALDNRGSRALGPHRVLADAELYSALGMGARTGLRLIEAGNRALSLATLSHDQWLGSSGGKVGLSLTGSRSRPANLAIIPLNLETSSNSLNLAYSYPVWRGRSENLGLRASFAAHSGETRVFGVKDTADKLRSLRFGASWDRADALAGVNLVDVEYSHGLTGMGASRNGDPFLSRPQARVDYSKVNLYAARQQSLSGNWSALAALSGQYAFTRLLSSELFGFGGEQFGRGYDPSELVGDHGAALKLELRYSGSFGSALGEATWMGYGFYDAGQVRQRDAAGLAARTTAASAGAGVRVNVGRRLSVFGELAQPLNRDVAAEADRKARFYGGIAVRY